VMEAKDEERVQERGSMTDRWGPITSSLRSEICICLAQVGGSVEG
jgi:hypothetical protein